MEETVANRRFGLIRRMQRWFQKHTKFTLVKWKYTDLGSTEKWSVVTQPLKHFIQPPLSGLNLNLNVGVRNGGRVSITAFNPLWFEYPPCLSDWEWTNSAFASSHIHLPHKIDGIRLRPFHFMLPKCFPTQQVHLLQAADPDHTRKNSVWSAKESMCLVLTAVCRQRLPTCWISSTPSLSPRLFWSQNASTFSHCQSTQESCLSHAFHWV